jgi:hypothetical protein
MKHKITLQDLTLKELRRYYKANLELLDRYVNNIIMECPLCDIARDISWKRYGFYDYCLCCTHAIFCPKFLISRYEKSITCFLCDYIMMLRFDEDHMNFYNLNLIQKKYRIRTLKNQNKKILAEIERRGSKL